MPMLGLSFVESPPGERSKSLPPKNNQFGLFSIVGMIGLALVSSLLVANAFAESKERVVQPSSKASQSQLLVGSSFKRCEDLVIPRGASWRSTIDADNGVALLEISGSKAQDADLVSVDYEDPNCQPKGLAKSALLSALQNARHPKLGPCDAGNAIASNELAELRGGKQSYSQGQLSIQSCDPNAGPKLAVFE